MEILGKLLGSEERVRVMRLFLLNPDDAFDAKTIEERSKVSKSFLRKEIQILQKIGFAKSKTFFKEIERRRGSNVKMEKKKVSGWQLSLDFKLLAPLKNLLISTEPVKKDDIIARFKKTGKVKLIVLAGVFINRDDSRADIMVVGDDLKRKAVENALRHVEAEIGKELSYALFETQDFVYRINVYDKFVRDILDFPHEKILDKIGIN